MEPDFWHQRWQQNQIAFHKEGVHTFLKAHAPRLGFGPGEAVFVPLCGKSHDMRWLHEQGYRVLGVELSPIAVHAFFEEYGLPWSHEPEGAFTAVHGGNVRLLCGDFFDLRTEQVRGVSAIYDRAALVALPAARRRAYVDHLLALLPAAPLLLVTLDYPQERMDGPPFAVSDDEVRSLFEGARGLEVLSSRDVLEHEPRFRERGLPWLRETAYLVG